MRPYRVHSKALLLMVLSARLLRSFFFTDAAKTFRSPSYVLHVAFRGFHVSRFLLNLNKRTSFLFRVAPLDAGKGPKPDPF